MSWSRGSIAELWISEVVISHVAPDCEACPREWEPIHFSAHSVNLWTLAAASAFNTSSPLHSWSLSRNLHTHSRYNVLFLSTFGAKSDMYKRKVKRSNNLWAMTVTVSARVMVRLRHADTHEAKKEVRKAARVKSWAPANISFLINCDAAASSCVVLDMTIT